MKIKKEIIEKLIAHAQSELPNEACGYLAAKEGIISASFALTNIDHSEEHFSFSPKEQFQALKDARAKGLEICAVYHSHPHTPARPSAEDIKLAFDAKMLYVIISLAEKQEEIRAFRIKSQKAEPVNLEVFADERI